MALMTRPKIRLGTTVIDFIILARQEALNSPKHEKSLQIPQRDLIRSANVNHVSRTCAYFSH